MAFSDTYRESIQDKHLGNVGFTSTAKGVTNESYALKNPHSLTASQIPVVDVVSTYGALTASGIAAGVIEEHIVKLTADPTVNGNKAWIANEQNCTTSGHSARGDVRLDQWQRVAETEYKLRLFADDGTGNAPDYSSEILPSETNFNWEYNASAGVVFFDADPTGYYTGPLWGKLYTYIGEYLSDKVDATVSGGGKTFLNMTDGVNTATAASSQDTFTFVGTNGVNVLVDSSGKVLTISGAPLVEKQSANLSYVGSNVWEYNGNFSTVPDDLEVHYLGVKQKNSDSEYYSAAVVSGVLQVTFGFSTYSEDWADITWGGEYAASGLLKEWITKTANYTALVGDRIMVDTDPVTGASSTYTISLPATPSIGSTVSFLDAGGNCGTVPVTIGRNGKNIMGLAQDMSIDTDNASFNLVYYNASKGWRIEE